MCTINYIDHKIPNQPKETYYGNREYKLHLLFKKINIKNDIIQNEYEFNNDFNNKLNDEYYDKSRDEITNIFNEHVNEKIKNFNNKNDTLKYNLKSLDVLKCDNLEKINKRATQLLFRLNEGNGKALYLIGINDNGIVDGISLDKIIESYHFMNIMIQLINAKMQSFKIYKGNKLYVSSVRIYLPNYQSDFF